MTYVNVLDDIPQEITAGESVSWKKSLSDYPASESWELTYSLVNSSGRIQIVSTAEDDDHLIEVAFSTTAAYTAGEYHYQAHISDGSERYLVDEGEVTILPDFAEQSSGYDNRPWYDIAIDALELSIRGRASKTQLMQTVSGIQIQHMSLNDQLKALRKLKATKLSIKYPFGKPQKVGF